AKRKETMSLPLDLKAIHEVPEHWAQVQPDAACLYDNGKTVSYGELWQRVERAAAWLDAQNVAAGDRVLVAGENCAAMVVMLFACSLRQAWPVGVNARLSARELDTISAHARPALMLYTSDVSSAAA